MTPPERFVTSRLFLRKPTVDDAGRVFSTYAHDPVVTKFLAWHTHESVGDAHAFLSACLENWSGERDFAWAIESKDSGEFMGMIGCRIEQASVHIGYVLGQRFWNQGFMTEAVRVLTDWALRQETFYRVWAVCDTENVASARVLEKAGMQREGILRRWIVLPNINSVPRDCLCYSKVR